MGRMNKIIAVLEAKTLRKKILSELAEKISVLPRSPALAAILVGESPASLVYIENKKKTAKEIGMDFRLFSFPNETSESEILEKIDLLNRSDCIDGIIVQLPLPPHIGVLGVIHAIDPEKDVDGFTPENIGKLFLGDPRGLASCTPKGIMRLLKHYEIDVVGKRMVIVGRSNIVGKPLALLAIGAGATVTSCNSHTPNLADITREADILVVSIGKKRFITADMVKEGATVIDVGMNRDETGLAGDVDFENVIKKARCSPVPGGVGLMTVTMLMENTLEAYRKRNPL